MRFFAIFALALVAAAPAHVAADGPGLGATFTDAGLDTVVGILDDVINDLFQDVTLPDVHIDTHVAEPLGHITLDLTDIVVKNLKIGGSSFLLGTPADVSLDLSSLDADISLNYKYRKVNWPHLSDHGEVTVKPSGGTLKTTLDFSITSAGSPTVAATGTSSHFDSFDIHFDGKVAWLYNLLISLFKGDIGKSIDSAIATELSRVVDTSIASALAKIPTDFHIGGGKSEVVVNASFTEIAAKSSLLAIQNDFAFSTPSGSRCPFPRVAIPPATPAAEAAEFQIMISDTIVSCPAWVLTTDGALEFLLSPTSVPSLAKYLNTDTFKIFIPPLYAKYPDQPLQVNISAASSPVVKTSSSEGLEVSAKLDLDMSALSNTSVATHACTLGLALDIGLEVYVNQSVGSPPVPAVALKLTDLNITFSVVQSSVGSISVSTLQGLISFALPLVEKAVEGELSKFSVPLPTLEGLTLKAPEVTYYPGYFAVTSNLTFTPPLAAAHAPTSVLAL